MIRKIPRLSFYEAILTSTGKIFQFHGRSRRSEFWWTGLFLYSISMILFPLWMILGLSLSFFNILSNFGVVIWYFLFSYLLNILIVPLTFRRLHDTGRSGWWSVISMLLSLSVIVLLYNCNFLIDNEESEPSSQQMGIFKSFLIISCIAFIYWIILYVFLCLDSKKIENKYGPSPKYVDDDNTNS